MKGTLFSADLVNDKDGNIRLLELNTDTAFFKHFIDNELDFTELHTVLSDPMINELYVIHKPAYHRKFVNKLSDYVTTNLPNITLFTEVKENEQNIFPANVPDANNKFILRLAYDALALFDSEYCANTLNPLKLFVDNNDTGSITELYHSSSLYGVMDTLSRTINQTNVPDVVIKKVNTPHFSPEFAKIGYYNDNGTLVSGSEFNTERYNQYLNTITNENTLVQTYHIGQESIDLGHNYSYRGYFLVYGSNLDLITLGITKWPSILPLPSETDIQNDINLTQPISTFSGKHYYEFATNTLNDHALRDGLYETELITLSSLDKVPAGDLASGLELQSYNVGGGAPNTDDYVMLLDWSYSGNTLPAEGTLSNSTIVGYQKNTINSSIVYQLTFEDGSTFKASMYLPLLCYELSSDTVRYKQMHTIEPGDQIFDISKNKIGVTLNEILVLNETYTNFVSFNIEDADVFVATNSNILVHNSPCFVAGTKIKMSDDTDKNIEDVVVGDIVKTFNHVTNTIENNEVLGTMEKGNQPTITYTLSNGDTIECTYDHPLYVNEKGYSSFDPEQSLKEYDLVVRQIAVGDSLKNLTNEEIEITSISKNMESKKVYNLSSVDNNHNFYANNILVHNRVK